MTQLQVTIRVLPEVGDAAFSQEIARAYVEDNGTRPGFTARFILGNKVVGQASAKLKHVELPSGVWDLLQQMLNARADFDRELSDRETAFWARVDRRTSHWFWLSRSNTVMWDSLRRQPAAVAWLLLVGDWPDKRLIPACGVKGCIRPAHHKYVGELRVPVREHLPPKKEEPPLCCPRGHKLIPGQARCPECAKERRERRVGGTLAETWGVQG